METILLVRVSVLSDDEKAAVKVAVGGILDGSSGVNTHTCQFAVWRLDLVA